MVYIVKQTQPSADYEDKTIYVLSYYDKAVDYARKLNKEYAQNVKLSEQGDFIEVEENADWDSVHFYEVEAVEVDKDLVEFF